MAESAGPPPDQPAPSSAGRRFDGVRGRHLARLSLRRAPVLAGLAGVAVTQPVLDLFGDNPEFFVAGNYTATQIVLFALAVALLPAAVLLAMVTVVSAIDRRAGNVAFLVAAALPCFAFALVLLRTLRLDVLYVVVLLAAAFAAGAVYLLLRARAMQMFVSYLAVANLLFVTLFLFSSSTSRLVTGSSTVDGVHSADVPAIDAPVVIVVLDELPAATIMRADGSINADRYPGFARLADVSTWYRNASSPHPNTQLAVPALLTGSLAATDDPATYIDYPENLFTMVGGDVEIERYEAVTNLCPSNVCEPAPPQPLRQALADAAILYGHRVAPSAVRDRLPTTDEVWGGFAQDRSDDFDGADDLLRERWFGVIDEGNDALSQSRLMYEQITEIDATPRLHYMHVLVPHSPWILAPTGATVTDELEWAPFAREDPDEPWHDFRRQVFFQLHSMQVGATDVLIGELLNQLQNLPNWEETLLVVTSDHGTSFLPPELGRERVTADNRAEVHRVPLFIKAPGQTDGEVSDESAQLIDVVPSIVDLLGIELGEGWEFDGRSLYDGSAQAVEPVVSEDVDEVFEIADAYAEPFPHGDDWIGLAAVGEHGELVGEQVDDLDVDRPSRYRASFDDPEVFASLPLDGTMPFTVTGVVEAPGDEPPPELLIAVNDRIAGVVGGYDGGDGEWEFVGYVADVYERGHNDVELYEVEVDGDGDGELTLRPAT